MKNVLFALLAAVLFTGCASTDQLSDLESRIGALESATANVGDAASDAAAAAAAATAAGRDAASAKSTAERALDAANEANERAERMAETCCSRK